MPLISALLFLLLCTFLDAQMLTRQQVKMGTFASITLQEHEIEHAKMGFTLLDRVENALSSYKESSPISQLNRFGYALLDRDSLDALHLSQELYIQTDGYFDISIGKLTHGMYAFGKGDFLPHPALRKNALFSLKALKLQESSATLLGENQVDLGGMGKGYGVDVVIAYLKEQKLQKAVVALSGDIRCLGECFIAIANPYDTLHHLATFRLKAPEMGVSTSGNYHRYIKNQNNNHLINPKLKTPQRTFDSVTLIARESSAKLDGFATAVSVMPKQKAFAFLKGSSMGYIVVEHENQKVTVSENILDFVTDLQIFLMDKNSSH